MNLVRYQPNPLNLLDNVSNWFDDMFVDFPSTRAGVPAVDVRETESAYLMEVDLPGMSEKDVEVKLDNNLLTVSSRKSEDKEQKADGYILRERRRAEFCRSFVLPEEVDKEKIEAEFKNGVLHLSFPKVPAAKPKTIEVRKA